ncbi:MAG: PIN domain-containing protein [Archangium sp.]|nr:PIN domain-containing protein [Archangium sp.]
MIWLLDGNMLVAICCEVHVHHQRARTWFLANVEKFATCPVTQGTLLRTFGPVTREPRLSYAWEVLEILLEHPGHEFWPDVLDYRTVSFKQLQGGAQVTDAYLAALARHNGGRVATLDRAFAALHPDVVTEIGAT